VSGTHYQDPREKHYLGHRKLAKIDFGASQSGQSEVLCELRNNLVNDSSITRCHRWVYLLFLVLFIRIFSFSLVTGVVIEFF
jgi:hypothetical protein